VQSHAAAIDRIESIVRSERIDCDFERVDAFLFLAEGGDEEFLDDELAALHRAGMASTQKVQQGPLPFLRNKPCLHYRNQGQFHPLKYLRALIAAIARQGGWIFPHSHVDGIEGEAPARAKVGPYLVTAESIVVATNSPVNDLVEIHTKQAGYMTYVVGARIPRNSVPHALFWDTEDPYHYVRVHPGLDNDSDVLIVGGEDHKTGQAHDTTERHARLEAWARLRFPMMEQIEYTWAGQVMETIDGLGFIGRNPLDEDNVYIATGDSGMGMTHGTIAGMLLTDLILGRENPWAKLYDPSRKTLRALPRYAKEAANMAAQYADWLTDGDLGTAEEVAPGGGAVLRRGLTKVALYRDENGTAHYRSAVCPHLGGIVHWNESEKTWDCPCHGSRFDAFGHAINGPANSNLARVKPDI